MNPSVTQIVERRLKNRAAWRLALLGDSRPGSATLGAGGNGSTIVGNRFGGMLLAVAQDMVQVFAGGIGGAATSTLNSATRGTINTNPIFGPGAQTQYQSLAGMIASNPDVCVMQIGITDLIAGTANATVTGNIQTAIDTIMAAGIPLVFVSIESANDVSTTYVTGAASAGGFITSTATKAQNVALANRTIRDYINNNYSGRAIFVNTHDLTLDPGRILGTTGAGDPYGYTNSAYMADGTYMRLAGVWAIIPPILAAVRQFCPQKKNMIPYIGPDVDLRLMKQNLGSNLVGSTIRWEEYSAGTSMTAGTVARTDSMTYLDGSSPCQQCILVPSALASGLAGVQMPWIPRVGSTDAPIPIKIGDVILPSMRCIVDDGAGGTPTTLTDINSRLRVLNDDATTLTSEHFGTSNTGDTTSMCAIRADGPVDIRLIANPITATKASANITAGLNNTYWRIVLSMNAITTPVRVRLLEPSLQIIQRT